MIAHIMDFHIVFSDGMDHRHQHGLQEQHSPGISAWPSEVVQTLDITITSGSRTDHRHQHSFKQQHRSLMPTWLLAAEQTMESTWTKGINTGWGSTPMHPLAVAETTDTSMASGGSRGHRGLLRKPDPKKKMNYSSS